MAKCNNYCGFLAEVVICIIARISRAGADSTIAAYLLKARVVASTFLHNQPDLHGQSVQWHTVPHTQ